MNKGFDPAEIARVKKECLAQKRSFIYAEDHDPSDNQIAHLYFVGSYEGKEVVFDTMLYTLEMEYFNGLEELAMEEIAEKHPKYADADFDTEGPHLDLLYEIMDEIAAEDAYKVQEYVDMDEDTDYGIMLDVCLNKEVIGEKTIDAFIKSFKDGTLELDETLYSFSFEDEDDE